MQVKERGQFQYIEQGEGQPLILLHGLFGALSNWQATMDYFSQRYKVVIPLIPIYRGKPVMNSLNDIENFILEFIDLQDYGKVSLIGNSLGGHIGLLLTLNHPEKVRTLTLTGSSGLFEHGMGVGFVKRGNYDFIKERVAYTFYSPKTATKELVDEVFSIVNDRVSAIRVIKVARDAQRQNLRDHIPQITVPTCLIWGLNDNITPTSVAHEFHELLPNSELNFVDHAGHAPMMEQSEAFNAVLIDFLDRRLGQNAHPKPHVHAG